MLSEIETWAKLNPEAPLGEDQLMEVWHWLRIHGPSSSWTNREAIMVRKLLLEVMRLRLKAAARRSQRKSRMVKIAEVKRGRKESV